MASDVNLLRQYVESGSQDAFRELVNQRIGLVYSAAIRQVGDAHLANEVTQSVFLDLARRARSLLQRPCLAGWLYTSTRFAAAKARRAAARRLSYESEASAMNDSFVPELSKVDWAEVRPVIDQAMHRLGSSDREIILLRFFQGSSFADIGKVFGISDNTARMRVERSLEKLRRQLVRHGITSTAALGGALMAHSAVAVPAGLTVSVSSAAMAGAASAVGVAALSSAAWWLVAGVGASALIGVFLVRGPSTAPDSPEVEISPEVVEEFLPLPSVAPIQSAPATETESTTPQPTVASPPPKPAGKTDIEVQVKAAYLFNFAKEVTWPGAAAPQESKPYVIGTLVAADGTDPSGMLECLERTIAGKTFKSHPMQVIPVKTLEDAALCHVLFLGGLDIPSEGILLHALEGKPILTVSDVGHGYESSAAIAFVFVERNIRWMLNVATFKANSLSPSSALSKLALRVVDRPTTGKAAQP